MCDVSGKPTLFLTLSAADIYWGNLHYFIASQTGEIEIGSTLDEKSLGKEKERNESYK